MSFSFIKTAPIQFKTILKRDGIFMRMFFKDSKKETGFIDNLKHRIPNMKYYEIKVGTTEILKGLLMQNEQDFANVVIDTNGKFIFYFPIYTESSEYIITPTSFGEAVDNIANEVSSEIKSTLFELATKCKFRLI